MAGEKQQPVVQSLVQEYAAGYFSLPMEQVVVRPLTGDASTRQYFRLTLLAGQTYVVAHYPESIDPLNHPFCQTTRLLQAAGVPVPQIIDVDGINRLMLQDDLGDLRLQDWLPTANEEEHRQAYQEAIDLVLQIQAATPLAAEMNCVAAHLAFDEEKLGWELRFFYTNFFEKYLNCQPDSTLKAALFDEFTAIAQELASAHRVLCHRDFHSRNLMMHQGRQYVIDHQDARMGPVSYDLASLLGDPYVDLSDQFVQEMYDYFIEHRSRHNPNTPNPSWSAEFEKEYRLMAVQRLLKATGTYSYQMAVMSNDVYLPYIPRALRGAMSAMQRLGRFTAIRSAIERFWNAG
jgi:hypothetical protein